MPCYHPSYLDVLRKSSREEARRADSVKVPCGRCVGCRANQARQWAIRIKHTADLREGAFFATLTYEDSEVPDYGSLNPEDVRRFLNRVRKKFPPRTLSYFLCGEYGDETRRPHYHAVLLGPQFLDRDVVAYRQGRPVWISGTLEDAWGHGFTELTAFTPAAAAYVAGYVTKKIQKRGKHQYTRVDEETGELVQLVPEFSRMSKRPALGRQWIERYWKDVYPRDYVTFNGRQYKPPRYYDKWMDKNHPQIMDEVREKRWLEVQEQDEESLVAAEKTHLAKDSLFKARTGV